MHRRIILGMSVSVRDACNFYYACLPYRFILKTQHIILNLTQHIHLDCFKLQWCGIALQCTAVWKWKNDYAFPLSKLEGQLEDHSGPCDEKSHSR